MCCGQRAKFAHWRQTFSVLFNDHFTIFLSVDDSPELEEKRSKFFDKHYTVRTRIKEHVFWALGWFFVLYIESFPQNQPENALKVFFKLFLKLKYCIEYRPMKSMRKHNILIN